MASPDNKRVAKNAIALTLRMVFVTIVGLYTSRVVLEALGVDDYGIYGVVGGVIGMASFLNTSMAGATSRFITYELGRKNEDKLKDIFSTALKIHFIIALIVMILGETVGLWFVNSKMNFPPDRMVAVNILYQFTVLSTMVSFTQVPYTATIIAHEKMSIYAYFEIINVVFKLIIVYVLLTVSSHRLILYGAMMFVVSVIIAMLYRFYCVRNFSEARLTKHFEKKIAKEMLSFSIYDLYGNLCISFKYQGQPIILNIFYGVVANAAATITTTVSSVIFGLTINVFSAFRPQIIKKYASGLIAEMQSHMRIALQFTIFFFGIIAIPIILNTSEVLYLWLGQIPLYSVNFIQLVLLCNFLTIIIQVNTAAIHASGRIKTKSLISGTLYLLSLVLAYLFLKNGFPAYFVYIADMCMMATVVVVGIIIINHQIKEFKTWSYCYIIIRSIIPAMAALLMGRLIVEYNFGFVTGEPQNALDRIFRFALFFVVINAVYITLYTIIAFGNQERKMMIDYLRKAVKKLCNNSHYHKQTDQSI